MQTDSLFYRLLQIQPTLAFELAGESVPEAGRYRFISQEIKQTAFRLDGIAEPPQGRPEAPRGYVEVQFQPDEGFYPRFFSELFLHLRQYPCPNPWQAVVVYPSAGVERHCANFAPLLALPGVRRVYLDRLPLLESQNPGLWLIALILAETQAMAPIVDKIHRHNADRSADAKAWLELLETVLVYKLPKLTREEILKMFNFTDISLEETRYYQDAVAKGLEKGLQKGLEKGMEKGMERGMEKGMEKGMEQGLAQGLAQGEAAVLLRQLERKFHPLPDAARQRLAGADAETLLAWAERILDAQSLDEVWGQ